MRNLLVTAGLSLLMGTVASAATCASLVTIDVASIGSCTVDLNSTTYTFSNFQYALAGGSGTPLVDLTGVTTTGTSIILSFNPNEQAGAVTDIYLQYQVSGSGQTGADLVIAPADVGAAISEENCGVNPSNDAALSGTVCGTALLVLSVNDTACVSNSANCSAQGNFTGPQSTVWVWKDLQVAGLNGHNSSFQESVEAVPEPMTLSLLGAGLVGLGFLGRRLRK